MSNAPRKLTPRQVSFGTAFRYWVKLGFVNFGGPAGQIAIMHRDLVERRGWISEERFLHALSFCMLLPGPEAQQLAIYIGWLLHRAPGGIVAGAFFVIPSVFILLGLSYAYAAYGEVPLVAAVLNGFKPVVVAIIAEAVLRIAGRTLRRRAHVVIAAAAFVAIYFLHVPFPWIVLGAAGTGLAGRRLWPGAFAGPVLPGRGADVEVASASTVPMVAAPASARALESLEVGSDSGESSPLGSRALRVLAIGLVLWALPLAALVAWRGWGSLHTQEFLFFTKAALVTFGGAYAVLAYVTQAAVGEYGWLTQAQALDGLALAETTPGPLIMVLQFVGFMAGWNDPEGLGRVASAVLGACVTTYATFLPCFLFIFIGAPYIEVLRGNEGLQGALTGVMAAVVGVILNLAVVFGTAVLLPEGPRGDVDWFALVLGVAAFAVLRRLGWDVLWVVLLGGAVGLGRELVFG